MLTPRHGVLDRTRHTFLGRIVTRVAASPVALAILASPVPGAELALINHVDLTTPLEPRRLIKWVVG